MKILVTNLPWKFKNMTGIRAGSRWPHLVNELTRNDTIPYPFFLGYTTSILLNNGYETFFIDAIAEFMETQQYLEQIINLNPDVILIETSTPSFYNDINICSKIKGYLPETKIVLSGPHITYFADDIIEKYIYIDALMIGEYEHNFLDYIKQLENKIEMDKLKGIFLRINDNQVYKNKEFRLTDLNEFPIPYKTENNIYNYNDWFCKNKPNTNLMATRGCPFGCSFCLWPKTMYNGNGYRKRNVDNVMNEIEYIYNNFNINEFYFDDDSINVDKNYFKELCKTFINSPSNFVWSAMANTLNIDNETIELLKQSNCEGLKLGVESATVNLKKTDINKTKLIFDKLKKNDIRIHATFSVGFPSETKQDIKKTLDMIFYLNPDTIQISYVIPFPGTVMYETLKQKNKISNCFYDYIGTVTTPIINDNISKIELKELVEDTYNKWRFFKWAN